MLQRLEVTWQLFKTKQVGSARKFKLAKTTFVCDMETGDCNCFYFLRESWQVAKFYRFWPRATFKCPKRSFIVVFDVVVFGAVENYFNAFKIFHIMAEQSSKSGQFWSVLSFLSIFLFLSIAVNSCPFFSILIHSSPKPWRTNIHGFVLAHALLHYILTVKITTRNNRWVAELVLRNNFLSVFYKSEWRKLHLKTQRSFNQEIRLM